MFPASTTVSYIGVADAILRCSPIPCPGSCGRTGDLGSRCGPRGTLVPLPKRRPRAACGEPDTSAVALPAPDQPVGRRRRTARLAAGRCSRGSADHRKKGKLPAYTEAFSGIPPLPGLTSRSGSRSVVVLETACGLTRGARTVFKNRRRTMVRKGQENPHAQRRLGAFEGRRNAPQHRAAKHPAKCRGTQHRSQLPMPAAICRTVGAGAVSLLRRSTEPEQSAPAAPAPMAATGRRPDQATLRGACEYERQAPPQPTDGLTPAQSCGSSRPYVVAPVFLCPYRLAFRRLELDQLVFFRISHQRHRLASLLDDIDLLGKKLAPQDDALVRYAK